MNVCEYSMIAFLGAGRAGKTSILHTFMFGTFQETYMETFWKKSISAKEKQLLP